jgi:hypothetical protein
MLLSGNPKELYKVLGAVEFFQLRREKELYQIVERARERSATNDAIAGIAPEKRRELFRVLRRIMALLIDPQIKEDAFDYDIIAIARRNPSLVLRSLIERVIARILKIKNSFIFIREVEYSINRTRRPKIADSNLEYNPVVHKALLQSLAQIVPYDRPENIDVILKCNFPNVFKETVPFKRALFLLDYLVSVMKLTTEIEEQKFTTNRLPAEPDEDDIDYVLEANNLRSVFNSFVPHKVSSADKIIQDNFAARHDAPDIPLETLMSIVPTIIPEKHEHDEIITIVEAPLAFFDSLGKEIKMGLREEIFPEEKILEEMSEAEKRELEQCKAEQRKEKSEREEEIDRQRTRREHLMKLIEEQNMTAHEKLMNERWMVDLFF